MHLKWKLAALYAQRTLLEGSFFVTEGIPHMAPEGIQYYSQVCGKLQCLSYWKGTYLSGLVTKKVCFFPELTYPEVTELRKSDINTFLFTSYIFIRSMAQTSDQTFLQEFGFPATCKLGQACRQVCDVVLACSYT